MLSPANIETPEIQDKGQEDGGTPRPNPVALEAMVTLTGAKPNADGAARELFSEDTQTVLVFKDGAVVRLQAAVTVGQLVFLTNKKSNQEVVCQVLRKRSYRPTMCYVELQFTEERVNFWGVEFPEGKKSAPDFKIVEQVQAEETTAEPAATPVMMHSAEDVEQLKKEVEALREQLALLEKKNVEEAAAKAMVEAAEAREAAKREAVLREAAEAMESVKARVSAPSVTNAASLKEELAGMNGPSPVTMAPPVHATEAADADRHPDEAKPELLMPAAKESKEPARTTVKMTLPVWRMEKSPEEQLLDEEAAEEVKAEVGADKAEEPKAAQAVTEEMLPKPELDFTNVPKRRGASRAPNFKLRKAGLVSVLVLVTAGGTWYGKWWKYLPIPLGKKSAVVVAPVSVVTTNGAPPVAGVTATSVAEKKEGNTTEGGEIPGGNGETVSAKGAAGKTVETDSAAGEMVAEKASPVAATATPQTVAAGKKAVAREKAARKTSGPAKVEDAARSAASAPAADAAASDAPLVAAKLLKAATPVYPPEAMRSYITGDVKAEVVVEASGRVGEVKVVSGPKALREAAVAALKQYEYAPATQGGRAVESKAVVVVKFWFNP